MTTAPEILASDWPYSLLKNIDGDPWDGHCPCAEIKGEGFSIDIHCWRGGCEHGCKFSGVHVDGTLDRETLVKIGRHIIDNNGWADSTDWQLVVNGKFENTR